MSELDPPRIDLRCGHPKSSSLPHAVLASACRNAASRLDHASESFFPLQYESSGLATPRFKRCLAEYLTSAYRGGPVDEGWLLTTNGVSHGLDLAVGGLSSPGEVVVMEEPTYFLVRQVFVDYGLEVRGVPGDSEGLDTAELERRLESGMLERMRLLYLVPTHGNPSGATLPPPRRRHLLALAARCARFPRNGIHRW